MRNRFLVEWAVVARLIPAIVACACLLANVPWAVADDAIAKWTKALKGGDERTRIEAIDTLGQMGARAKGATGDLAALLTDKSPSVRAHAAYALGEIGPDAREAAAALAAVVSDSDYHVQRMAIKALEKIRPDPKVVVQALGQALEDQDPSVRVAALHALTEYSDSAIPVLTTALESDETRYWAVLALGEIGPKAKGAVASLAAALVDKNPDVRREVLIALARIGPDAATAVPAIASLLEDPNAAVGEAAGYALGSIGPAAAGAADALRKAMGSENHMEQCVYCWALARIEPKNDEARAHAIKSLLAAVKDENPRVQSTVLRGLLDLGAPPDDVVPALAYVIAHGQEPAVGEALGALSTMGETAAPVLADALKRPEARHRAALLIAHLGPKAKTTVPALTAALADDDPEVRCELLFALAAIGNGAAPAAATIETSLADPLPLNRAAAAYALGRIGTAAQAALPQLQKALTSPDPLVRIASAYAVVHVAPGNVQVAAAAVPVLVQGLQSPIAAARRGAAEGLSRVGKPARTLAEGALRAATRDPDETVRKAALEALERMGAVLDAPPSISAQPREE